MPVLPDEQVFVPPTGDGKKLELTQVELDTLIETRLERERTKHAQELAAANQTAEDVRRESRLRQAKLEGRAAETWDQRLSAEASAMERDALELERLSMTFANRPGASLRAVKWHKEDPAGYRAARERYRQLTGSNAGRRPQPGIFEDR